MAPSFISTILAFGALAAAVSLAPAAPALPAGATTGEIGNVVVPGGVAPETQTLKATGIYPNSQRVKIRYGPYNMAGAGTAADFMSALTHESGTMNTVAISMKKPCSGSCGITRIQAGLEYANGSIANTANGAWLHHVVMMVSGGTKKDVTCASTIGMLGERFFSSGNERTPTMYGDIEKGTNKAVYPITKDNTFSMQLELMNMDSTARSVYYTMDYEFIPTVPSDYTQTKALWLDVTNCGASFVNPPANQKKFTLKMNAWTSTVSGQMLGVAGHLHDGGVNVNVYNNNKVVCDSTATYSVAGQGSLAMADSGGLKRDGPMSADMPHIDQMKSCTNMGPIKVGDKIYIDANYNFNQYMGMGDSGGMAPVMGIAIMFVSL